MSGINELTRPTTNLKSVRNSEEEMHHKKHKMTEATNKESGDAPIGLFCVFGSFVAFVVHLLVLFMHTPHLN